MLLSSLLAQTDPTRVIVYGSRSEAAIDDLMWQIANDYPGTVCVACILVALTLTFLVLKPRSRR